MHNRKATLTAVTLAGAIALSPIHAVAQTSDSSHPITNSITNGTCTIQVHRNNTDAAHWYGYDMSPELYTIRKLALSDVDLYQLIHKYHGLVRGSQESMKINEEIKQRLKSNHSLEDQDIDSVVHIILRNFDYILFGVQQPTILKNERVTTDPRSAQNALKSDDYKTWFTTRTEVDLATLKTSNASPAYNALRQQAGADHNTFLQTLHRESSKAIQACAEGKSYPEGLSDNAGMGEGSKPDENTTPPAHNGDNGGQAHDGMSSMPEKGGLSVGAIIGIVVGVLAAVAGLAALAFPAIKPLLDRLLPR